MLICITQLEQQEQLIELHGCSCFLEFLEYEFSAGYGLLILPGLSLGERITIRANTATRASAFFGMLWHRLEFSDRNMRQINKTQSHSG